MRLPTPPPSCGLLFYLLLPQKAVARALARSLVSSKKSSQACEGGRQAVRGVGSVYLLFLCGLRSKKSRHFSSHLSRDEPSLNTRSASLRASRCDHQPIRGQPNDCKRSRSFDRSQRPVAVNCSLRLLKLTTPTLPVSWLISNRYELNLSTLQTRDLRNSVRRGNTLLQRGGGNAVFILL